MRRWLGRLSFSLLAIAIAMGYTGYRENQERPGSTAVMVYYAVAVICGAVGLAGLRERHRAD